MVKQLISQGAEAKIFKDGNIAIKERVSKPYRIREIDEELIKQRTRREAKILEKLKKISFRSPRLVNLEESKIFMDFIQGFDRDQLVMMDFESNVAQDSWARIVDWFVEVLPIKELGFKNILQSEGRPPYKATDLLKLFLYAYKNKLRSSRELEKACRVNLEVIWLLKGLQPSARKIAYFRKNNSKAFKQAFRYFVVMLKDWDLIDGQTIAIDSFKIRAQNSLKNNFNQKKLDRHFRYIDDKIQQFEKELDQNEDIDIKKNEIFKSISPLKKSEKNSIKILKKNSKRVDNHK